MSNNTLIMVGLKAEQWDFLQTQLDVFHADMTNDYKKMSPAEHSRETIQDAKNAAHFLKEIIDDIADQISGVTEEMIEG